MSTTSTPVTPEINAYLHELFNSEDEFLRTLNEEAAAVGIPQISIAPEQTRLLQVLLRAINAQVVVEIGSLAGYSAIAMARALPPNGVLVACEINADHAAFIRRKVAEAGLSSLIHVAEGPALHTLPAILEQLRIQLGTPTPLDAVFIDADKPNYEHYLHLLLPNIRRHGLVMADNALGFGFIASEAPVEEADNVGALRSFNRLMSQHPALASTLIPLGDGVVVGTVL